MRIGVFVQEEHTGRSVQAQQCIQALVPGCILMLADSAGTCEAMAGRSCSF